MVDAMEVRLGVSLWPENGARVIETVEPLTRWSCMIAELEVSGKDAGIEVVRWRGDGVGRASGEENVEGL